MTVGELRNILESAFIDDSLVLYNYDDECITDINLVIDRTGTVTDIRFIVQK